jgi:hypothetical protein
MTDPIIDIAGRYWTIGGDGTGVVELDMYPDSQADCSGIFIFDRTNATRLVIALTMALAARPVDPIGIGELGETGEQLELPFPDPPWESGQLRRH